ncbi:MAG: Serine/threonine-protein kinase PknD (plasmid) [Chroococcopsis gigantea SAG 12.99]|jgi:serine/threonine protein kinase|nr:serine/threonine protein kinase [Chlorogloea purpurea SAG 13.99]MDV3002811.1 Serine/threonine-protein kinase PknD [Chroococcopsis gigantea SAG 12.99]
MINQLLQGRYLVIKELGKGGFGQTYLAQDTQYPGKPYCVVKQLQVDDPGSLEKAKELFAREAVTLARLGSHDRIPELKAYSEEHFYLVQDFVDGNTLREEISPQRRWEEKEIIGLLEDILKILIFIHDEGVIHRDIKPDNIMRRQRDGQLILIDFGAIKEKIINNLNPNASTIAGSRIYTVGYAPPEQTLGKTHFSSDIYALGMTAIEALTGVHPSLLPEDDRTGEIMWLHPNGQIVGIDGNNELVWLSGKVVSANLAEILNKMVRYRRIDRYSSAGEALEALHQLRLVTQPQIPVGQISQAIRFDPSSEPPIAFVENFLDELDLALLRDLALYFESMPHKIRHYHRDHKASREEASVIANYYLKTADMFRKARTKQDLKNLIDVVEKLKQKVSPYEHESFKYRLSTGLKKEILEKLRKRC